MRAILDAKDQIGEFQVADHQKQLEESLKRDMEKFEKMVPDKFDEYTVSLALREAEDLIRKKYEEFEKLEIEVKHRALKILEKAELKQEKIVQIHQQSELIQQKLEQIQKKNKELTGKVQQIGQTLEQNPQKLKNHYDSKKVESILDMATTNINQIQLQHKAAQIKQVR